MNAMTQQRIARDLTQRQLAERSGLAATTINEIETGKRKPRASTTERIEAALGGRKVFVTDALVTHAGDKHPVYVRLGTNGDKASRVITIPTHPLIDQYALIGAGFAADGDQFWAEVGAGADGGYEGPFGASAPTLSKALCVVQSGIIAALTACGIAPEFC